jgi:hypothetical protein
LRQKFGRTFVRSPRVRLPLRAFALHQSTPCTPHAFRRRQFLPQSRSRTSSPPPTIMRHPRSRPPPRVRLRLPYPPQRAPPPPSTPRRAPARRAIDSFFPLPPPPRSHLAAATSVPCLAQWRLLQPLAPSRPTADVSPSDGDQVLPTTMDDNNHNSATAAARVSSFGASDDYHYHCREGDLLTHDYLPTLNPLQGSLFSMPIPHRRRPRVPFLHPHRHAATIINPPQWAPLPPSILRNGRCEMA